MFSIVHKYNSCLTTILSNLQNVAKYFHQTIIYIYNVHKIYGLWLDTNSEYLYSTLIMLIYKNKITMLGYIHMYTKEAQSAS